MKTLAIIAALLLTGGAIYYVTSDSADDGPTTANADAGDKGSRKGRRGKGQRDRKRSADGSTRGSDHAVPADASLEE
ncbi:MAG: hypothetical protein AAF799_29360, partial [Myxococcota bacterium]